MKVIVREQYASTGAWSFEIEAPSQAALDFYVKEMMRLLVKLEGKKK